MAKDTQRSKVSEAMLDYLASVREGAPQAVTAKLSSKNQITLPVNIVRRLGLEPGDRLAVRVEGDRIFLRPQPRDWVQYFRGRLKGVYGNTIEEMDEYVRKERQSWEERAERLGY